MFKVFRYLQSVTKNRCLSVKRCWFLPLYFSRGFMRLWATGRGWRWLEHIEYTFVSIRRLPSLRSWCLNNWTIYVASKSWRRKMWYPVWEKMYFLRDFEKVLQVNEILQDCDKKCNSVKILCCWNCAFSQKVCKFFQTCKTFAGSCRKYIFVN